VIAWAKRSEHYRAAFITVLYLVVCIAAAAAYTITSRISTAEAAAEDARSEASGLRGMVEENQDDLASLRDDVDTLQSQVE
jgi:hypothetical protein